MRKLYFLLFVCYWGFGYSQMQTKINVNDNLSAVNISSSPSSSNFRIFGELAPSNYIGVTDVSVPLHVIKHRNYQIPLTLKYHNGMGNKVEMEGGVYGLGWHLTTGGVISLIKSKKFEGYDPNADSPIQGDFRFNKNLSRDDWSSKYNLNRLLGVEPKRAVTIDKNTDDQSLRGYVFAVNFNGFSGELYFDHNEKAHFRTKENRFFDVKVEFMKNDKSERVFNVPIVNGGVNSIKIDSNEIYQFTITDENGISYVFGGNNDNIEFSLNGHLANLKWEYADALAYGHLKNTLKIVPTAWYLKHIEFPNNESVFFTYQRERIFYTSKVHTNLRRIEVKMNGNKVELPERENWNSYTNDEQATILFPITLKSIVTPLEKVNFEYEDSHSRNLGFGLFDDFNRNLGEFQKSDLIQNANGYNYFAILKKNISFGQTSIFGRLKGISETDLIKPLRRLSKINISSTINLKSYNFKYSSSTSHRMKLTNIEMVDALGGGTEKGNYTFKYNLSDDISPQITSYNKDDYGFYSTKNNYLGYLNDSQAVPIFGFGYWLFPFKDNLSNRQSYISNRAPEISKYNTWEILNEIVYPSGGYTKFEYEPNMYNSIASNYPFVVIENMGGIEKPAGGVRLKNIKNFDSNHSLLTSKSFRYVKDYVLGKTNSSGVLTHVPTYFDFIKGTPSDFTSHVIDYFNWRSEDIYPADRLRGNHITYSEVTEIDDLDQSFIVYKYKNFDNGYNDKPYLNYASHHEKDLKDERGAYKNIFNKWDVISMGLERGQLMSETLYDKDKTKVKEIINRYNDNPNRFDDHIRILNLYDNHIYYNDGKTYKSFTYIASQIYTYTPYLKKKTVIDYIGGNSIVNSETSYQYNDTYKLLTEKTEKRGAKTFKTTYKYPFDFTESVYTGMVSKNIVAPVILEESFINDTKVSATKINYKLNTTIITDPVPYTNNEATSDDASNTSFLTGNNPDIIGTNYVPKDIEVQYKNGVWEKQVEFFEYDNRLNLLSSKDITGKTTNYLWSYKKTLPIWTIENVSYGTIIGVTGKNAINDLANDGEPSEEKMNVLEQEINANNELKAAFKTRYLYDPILGLTYKETPLGTKEYYKYDGFGRLIKVEDGDKNTLIEYEYNYKQN